MKIILNGDDAFSEEERIQYRTTILGNIYLGVKTLLEQMDELRIKFITARYNDIAATIKTLRFDECLNENGDNLKPDYASKVQRLWKDGGVQACFSRRSEFPLQDSVGYFLNKLEDIVAPEYLPSNDDILHARRKTENAYQHVFHPTEDKNVSMTLIDVGGQRELRKQWLPLFDDVTSVIFITSLSEFDQMLEESEADNRTEESIMLFKQVLKMRALKEIPVILFLNKKDLLEAKLNDIQFNDYFVDFDPKDEDLLQEAKKFPDESLEAVFIRQLYMEQIKAAAAEEAESGIELERPRKERQIYAHITQATNVENMKIIWRSISDIVLSSVLHSIGL